MSRPHGEREPLTKHATPGTREVKPSARQQRFEMLIGLLGFFTVVALVTTVVAEVRGKPALTEAVVLAAFALATYLAVRGWRR